MTEKALSCKFKLGDGTGGGKKVQKKKKQGLALEQRWEIQRKEGCQQYS